MRKIKFLLMIILTFVLFGCNKEFTVKDLEELQIIIEDKLAETGDYSNYSSCYVDESNMKVVVELFDISNEKQELFRKNIYDSSYIVFREAEAEDLSDIYDIEESFMTILNDTISRKGLTLIIYDTLDKHFYTNEYLIEKYDNGNWLSLNNMSLDFSSEGVYFTVDGMEEIEIDWTDLYGELDSGEYRIVKLMCDDITCNTSDNLYALFTID